MDSNIDVSMVREQAGKIFGKQGKQKLETLVKNEKSYSQIDDLKADIEILADKSVFDELLINEKSYFENVRPFSPSETVGDMTYTAFGTMYANTPVSTVKAVHGVKGFAYQYEVQLKSNDSSYLGWATRSCEFTVMRGVGETANSYGFNGYFMSKLNMSNEESYGEKWRIGNIIGCVIDFPKKTIEYYNNGRSLGVAFEGINGLDDAVEYFPAFTIFKHEHVSVNLGERPFKFPVQGARPVIDKPTAVVDYTEQLLERVFRLIDTRIRLQKSILRKTSRHSDKIVVNNVMNKVLVHQLAYLLKCPYVVDSCFLTFLNYMNKRSTEKLKVLLELMWENIPEHEMVSIMDHLLFCMLCEYQCIWRNKFDVSYQITVLKLLIEICKETSTRKHLIAKVFFNSTKFAYFLHIIAPTDVILGYMIPLVYWHLDDANLPEDMKTSLSKHFPLDNYKSHESSYNSACNRIKYLVNKLVNLQMAFLKTLLDDNDQTEEAVSSRILFSRRFQSFVQENMIIWTVDPTMKLPNPILLSTLFRLSRVVRELWNDELKEDNIARVHQNIFYLENFNYFGIHRLGGTFSELRSRHADDIKSKLGGRIFNSQNNTDTQLVTITSQNHSDNGSALAVEEEEHGMIEINSMAGLITVLTRIMEQAANRNPNAHDTAADTSYNEIFLFDNLPTDKRFVLSVLLNNIVCLYHVAGHKKLNDYVSFKRRLSDLSVLYAKREHVLRTQNDETGDQIRQELREYEKHIIVICRHVAWLANMIFIGANENVLEWLLVVISNTIKHCSQTEGLLFGLVPEFYIDNILRLLILLPKYPNKIENIENIIIKRKWLAKLVGEILIETFSDTRITDLNSRNVIIEAMTLYLTHPKSVEILQAVPKKSRWKAIQSILNPFFRGMWTKTNVILMLIWYGSGFGFRYTRPPHLENHNSLAGSFEENVFTNVGAKRPPANVLQNDLRAIIAHEKETAIHFIENSLNYLNWTFSEFISLFQDVSDLIDADETLTIITLDHVRKLKRCGNNFVYTVTLLRIIEMMIYFDRRLVTEHEPLLSRVLQLICQIFTRTHSSTSTFQRILTSSLPYLEPIHKFTILVPMTGILLTILDNEIYDESTKESDKSDAIHSVPEITKLLISEPNFNLSSMEFLVIPEHENDEPFTFNSYKNYFTDEELRKAAVMYRHLDWCKKRHSSTTSTINEDDLCIICYMKRNAVTLKPCEHHCCQFCIEHHLLFSRVCFFCKRKIESVVNIDDSSIILNHFGSQPPPL